MIRPAPPKTLLGRTALALAVAFLVFGLLTTILLQLTLVRPHTRQAADDLSAFLVLAAQIWVELPPYTRPDYEREMLRRHELRISHAESTPKTQPGTDTYLSHLEAALGKRIGQTIHVHRKPDHQGWLWVEFPMAGRLMRLGFRENRLHNRLLLILPLLAAVGIFLAFVLSVLLVRHITRPLADMAEAAHRIGQGDFSSVVPESGPREIAELARKLNRMEDRIGQLLENRTTLLAGISHDLRTPLARMRLELEMLRNDDNHGLIEDLGADITEMERLISQTLLLARGLGREDPVEVEIAHLLQEVADDFNRAGNRVLCQSDTDCLTRVQVNPLKRVLGNLVENAVAYSKGQAVTLECERAGRNIVIRVIDQGPEIPPSAYRKIFQPFQRLEESRSRSTGGSGLGLAIVDQLCRAYGWGIKVRAATDRAGNIFEVCLPPPGESR